MTQTNPQLTRHDTIDPLNPTDQTLVVVFLRGGADTLTLVPPVHDDDYQKARPILAVSPKDATPLNDYFSLNNDLLALHPYFDQGHMSITNGAGSEDKTRSHFEAQDLMEHAGESGSGWLGRYLRARADLNPAAPSSATSAVAIGSTRPESLRGAPTGAVMQTVREFAFEKRDDLFIDQLNQLYAAQATPLGLAGQNTLNAVHKLKQLRAADAAPANNAQYPKSNFARGLREIAKLIKADVGLVASTIDLPNWDTHYIQQAGISSKMRDLANSLHAFLTDLNCHPTATTAPAHQVTVVVMTEFGRRLKENSSFGTDHGAGSAMFLLGQNITQITQTPAIVSSFADLSPTSLDPLGDTPAKINYRDILAPILTHHTPNLPLQDVFPGHTFKA